MYKKDHCNPLHSGSQGSLPFVVAAQTCSLDQAVPFSEDVDEAVQIPLLVLEGLQQGVAAMELLMY